MWNGWNKCQQTSGAATEGKAKTKERGVFKEVAEDLGKDRWDSQLRQ